MAAAPSQGQLPGVAGDRDSGTTDDPTIEHGNFGLTIRRRSPDHIHLKHNINHQTKQKLLVTWCGGNDGEQTQDSD